MFLIVTVPVIIGMLFRKFAPNTAGNFETIAVATRYWEGTHS